MVAATSEGLERVSAERRARWLRRRRRRRAFWAVVAVATVAAIVTGLWPRGSAPKPAPAARSAPAARRVPTPRRPAPDLALKGLRAALPVAYGLTHGDPAQRMVALTFDDGPSGRTPAILRVLSRNHAHATFFVVGRATRGMEPVLRHIAATGNELADHTYSHADLLALRPPARKRQLQWTRGLVARATGRATALLPAALRGDGAGGQSPRPDARPDSGAVVGRQPRLAAAGTKAIVRRVLANVRPGAIVLMHDGGGDRQETLRALPAILRALQRRHLQVVTLSRMFATAPPASSFWSGSFEGGDARS